MLMQLSLPNYLNLNLPYPLELAMSALINFVNSLRDDFDVKDPDHLDTVHQVQIAIGFACTLPLPEAVTALAAWNVVRDTVRSTLDEINELFILDIPEVTELTKKQFMTRWSMVYNPRACTEILIENATQCNLLDSPADAAVVREHLDDSRLNNTITQLGNILANKQSKVD